MKLSNVELPSWVRSPWRNSLPLFALFWEARFVRLGGDDFVLKINMICPRTSRAYLKLLLLIALTISLFNFGNVSPLWRTPEALALATVRSMSLIASRNLFDGEARGLYVFRFFWYVITVCLTGFGVAGIIMPWLVADKNVLSTFFAPLTGRTPLDIFTIFKPVLPELGISLVVLFGVRISTSRSEPIEKLINVSRVNWSDGRRFSLDFFTAIDKSKIAAAKIIMVCFFMMRKSAALAVLNRLSSARRQ